MENTTNTALRISRAAILVNLALAGAKLAAGVIAHSGAMVSDAAHSASDVVSTIVVIIGMRAASKDSDREHPYGHERMECVAALLLAAALLVTGLAIGAEGVKKILSSGEQALEIPGALALGAAILSIIVKEVMYRVTVSAAKRIHSPALMADAWHHRSDALSSIGALIGIGGARLGLPVLDPIASLVICLMILKAAYDIFRDAVDKMVDRSVDSATEARLRQFVLSHSGIEGVDSIMTRKFGSRVYVEMEVSMDGDLSLSQSHDIAEDVHAEVEMEFPDIKHIMIHVNPAEKRKNGAPTGE